MYNTYIWGKESVSNIQKKKLNSEQKTKKYNIPYKKVRLYTVERKRNTKYWKLQFNLSKDEVLNLLWMRIPKG